jgi:uncharacterized protein YcbX
LKRLLPASKIDGSRFRPNFLVETAEAGFVENDWVGKDVNLGALAFQVYEPMRRCVMVTREQGTLPRDIEVIRTLQENNDRNAGVSLRTQDSGTLRCGDSIQA